MVRLFEEDKYISGRASSKGNQLKFCRDGIWYKADYTGYEGLVEYTVSKLLRYSSLSPEEYVDYDLEEIEYNGNIYRACKSRDFAKNWNMVTLERLFTLKRGVGLNRMIYTTEDHTKRLQLLVNQVAEMTGLKGFDDYMCKILTIDALFLNEDRHTHNLAVLKNDKDEFRLVPFFDQGAGLLADITMDYPLGRDIFELIPTVKAKTFSDSFDEQLDIAEELYGEHIHFHFGYKEVSDIVNAAVGYSDEIRARVIEVIMQMRRKYSYLFKVE